MCCGSLRADIAPVRSAGRAIEPVRESAVRMVSERVTISIDDSLATVSCRFVLKNEGDKKKLLVGFPGGKSIGTVQDFRARVDGKETAVTHPCPIARSKGKSAIPFSEAFTVPFGAPDKTVDVEVRYRTRLLPEGNYGGEDLWFTYILQTGAFWKGTIGEAVVTMDLGSLPQERMGRISPSGYARNGNTLTWRFTGLEPGARDNIEIRIMQKLLYDRLIESRALLKKDSRSARAHYLLGTVHFNRYLSSHPSDWRRDKAEAEFLRAVELDPGLLDARYFLAAIYHLRNGKGKPHSKEAAQIREILRRNVAYACADAAFPPRILKMAGIPDTRAVSWMEKMNRTEHWGFYSSW